MSRELFCGTRRNSNVIHERKVHWRVTRPTTVAAQRYLVVIHLFIVAIVLWAVSANGSLAQSCNLTNDSEYLEGQTYSCTVTAANSGTVWGSDPYTDDSNLGKAAIHAGYLTEGQTGTLTVRISPGLTSYSGTTSNGVTTEGYGDWTNNKSFSIIGVTGVTDPTPAPTANAGSNQNVATGSSVTLNASGSDGDSLSYSWSQIGGSNVNLSSSSSATPSFTAPDLAVNAPNETLTFIVTVSNSGGSDTDTVQVTVESEKNDVPTAQNNPVSVSVVEDVSSDVDLSSIVFADTESDPLTVTLSVDVGSFSAPADGSSIGVTADLVDSTTITLAGAAGDINSYLDTPSNIQYTTPANAEGDNIAEMTILVADPTGSETLTPSTDINATGTPDVISVSASTADGHYKAGETVSVQVTFDETVTTTTGGATLTLDVGGAGRAVPVSAATSSTTLTFDYTVQAGDNSAYLDYISTAALALAGGTIQGASGAADLILPSPGATGSLSANKAIVIDTTDPVVTTGAISLTGGSGTNGEFISGDTVTATWDTSAASEGDLYLPSSGSVTVDFSAFGGGNAVTATLEGVIWTATYALSDGLDAANLNVAVTATDEAGNTTTTTDNSNATVDTTVPVVLAANISLSGATGTGGAFKIGDTVTATWDNTASGDNNDDIASVSVDFSEFGAVSAVGAMNSSGTWTATYTITNGNIDDTNRNVTVTANDTAGNSNDDSGTDNVVVDNIDPTVVDGDITVSGGTGPSSAFKVGDTVTVEWTANNTDTVDTVEVDFSAFGGPAAATATESSGVWIATYVLPAGSLSSSSLQVSVTAYDDAGNDLSTTKATVYTANTIVPTVVVTGPTEIVTKQFTVDIEFSEPVSSDLVVSELRVENGSVASVDAVAGSSTEFTAAVNPVLGNTVLVQVLAGAVTTTAGGNSNSASNEFTIFAGNVATAFEEYREEVRKVLVDEAARSLTSILSANQRMMQQARDRFIGSMRQVNSEPNGLPSRNTVPFDVNGSFELNGTTLSTRGEFFEQTGDYAGTKRRLFFGDFDIQHDVDTDSTTATLTARVAWEQRTSDRTMLGYFIGGELARSTIDGAFEGDQDRVGLTVGGYAVHQLHDDLFLDGFLTLGAGRNDLEMANDVLALTSDYTTRTATIGAALSGVYEYEQYELRPELAFSYGKTWIGNVGFAGRAYGLVDDTLSLDAGDVSIANFTLRPEVVWALDADTVADSNSQFSFAPRLICERRVTVQRTNDCGGGAELGLRSTSDDGLSNVEFRVIMDKVGDTTRSSFALNIEHQF